MVIPILGIYGDGCLPSVMANLRLWSQIQVRLDKDDITGKNVRRLPDIIVVPSKHATEFVTFLPAKSVNILLAMNEDPSVLSLDQSVRGHFQHTAESLPELEELLDSNLMQNRSSHFVK